MSELGRTDNRFDFLRLLAALLVLWSHCFPLAGLGDQEPLARWTGLDTLGGLGVAVFFVLSGYLITLSWERQPQLRVFVRNRALRIYPALLLLCLLSMLVLGPWLTRLEWSTYFTHTMTWRYLLNATAWTVAYPLPGVFESLPVPSAVNGSLWSLPYEVRCYLVLVLVAMVAGRRVSLRLKAALVLTALCLVWLARPTTLSAFDRFWGLDHYHLKLGIYFSVGAVFAAWRQTLKPHWWMAMLLGLMAWGAATGSTMLLLVWLAVGVGVLWLALKGAWLPVIPQRWGDWSYGCYLYGFPIQQVLVSFEWHQKSFVLFVVLSTVLTLLAGALSWHFIERHAIRWKRSHSSIRVEHS